MVTSKGCSILSTANPLAAASEKLSEDREQSPELYTD